MRVLFGGKKTCQERFKSIWNRIMLFEERTRRCDAGSSEAFGSAWVQFCAEFGRGVGGCAGQAAAGVKLSKAG